MKFLRHLRHTKRINPPTCIEMRQMYKIKDKRSLDNILKNYTLDA